MSTNIANRGRPTLDEENHIPELIQLPDGRLIPVADIVNRVSQRETFRLIYQRGQHNEVQIRRHSTGRTPYKYSASDREWIAEASIPEIRERYGLSFNQACILIQNTMYILGRPSLSQEQMRGRM